MTGTLVSIIIPVASYHASVLHRALDSVYAQTVPCEVVVVDDHDRQGAGWARNKGVAKVSTPFVMFLDADDYLEPNAIERMLDTYQQGYYVYTDDEQGGKIHATPDCEVYLIAESWHSVSCLVPLSAHHAIGGFDETLPALEDKDYYLKLQAAGICGRRAAFPLLHYTNEGQRSKRFDSHPEREAIRKSIYQKYLGRARMGCNCGGTAAQTGTPDDKEAGDVLATALYTPMKMRGRVSGRLYAKPSGANNYQMWVDPADVAKSPSLWQAVYANDLRRQMPTVDSIREMALRELSG